MRTPRQEELGKRLVALMRSDEERREDLNTWELANINCKVNDVIEGVKEAGGSMDNQEDGIAAQRIKIMDDEEVASNEVKERLNKVANEVKMEEGRRRSDSTLLMRSSNFTLAVASISILAFLLARLCRQHLDN